MSWRGVYPSFEDTNTTMPISRKRKPRKYKKCQGKSQVAHVYCPTEEAAADAMKRLLESGRTVMSVPIHRIIDDVRATLRERGMVDLDGEDLRKKSPAVLLVTGSGKRPTGVAK